MGRLATAFIEKDEVAINAQEVASFVGVGHTSPTGVYEKRTRVTLKSGEAIQIAVPYDEFGDLLERVIWALGNGNEPR